MDPVATSLVEGIAVLFYRESTTFIENQQRRLVYLARESAKRAYTARKKMVVMKRISPFLLGSLITASFT